MYDKTLSRGKHSRLSWWIPFVWTFIFFLIQNSFNALIAQKAPIFLLAVVLFFSFREGAWRGAMVGVFAGLLLEVFGQGRLGSEMLVLGLMGFIFGWGTKTFFQESPILYFLVPLLAFYFVTYLRLFLFYFASQELAFFGRVALDFFWTWDAVGMAVLSPLIFSGLRRVIDGVSSR